MGAKSSLWRWGFLALAALAVAAAGIVWLRAGDRQPAPPPAATAGTARPASTTAMTPAANAGAPSVSSRTGAPAAGAAGPAPGAAADASAAANPDRLGLSPRYGACLELASRDPAAGLANAEAWAASGGDPARHCATVALVNLGRFQEAASRLEELAVSSNAPASLRAALYGQAGQAWMMAENPVRAFGAATLGLTIQPDNVDLLIDRAVAAGTAGNHFEALDDLHRAVDVAPDRAEALVLRASAWRALGHADLARDDVARALALDPGNPEALLERGLLRRAAGDAAGARADWERVRTADPDSAAAAMAQRNLEELAAAEVAGPTPSPAAPAGASALPVPPRAGGPGGGARTPGGALPAGMPLPPRAGGAGAAAAAAASWLPLPPVAGVAGAPRPLAGLPFAIPLPPRPTDGRDR